ncbi:ADP-ribosylglycohydrolase [Caldicoprobacter guelmensis]|uniref:ADP-ribosylglycohydrolase family protein n=1 Tax=Caldicoprobacter guelmensis TaxID=1170224 RepID=UPI001FAFA66D|nr:ADP-ribosylglycohydrolase family protein [Caldicoprobacter guelmensis]MBM7582562.1 ADP-ribosylglycohydrolase [Caldicoprobacter guelmensis]
MKKDKDHFRGCLLGGAIGDALGWPVEFMRTSEIKAKYGESGITDLVVSINGKAEITDDTQMTLFTAEGILLAEVARRTRGNCDATISVYRAYLRWLHTQGSRGVPESIGLVDGLYEGIYSGWLYGVKELHARRGPGNTCLSALSSGKMGTIDNPINNSKGCGGVMRVAPAGLFYPKDEAFEKAAEFAATTHGHPSGYLSAGALAYIIALIMEGEDIEAVVKAAIEKLKWYEGSEECIQSLNMALELSKSDISDIDAILKLGEGWVGEEALGIATYCALKYRGDFKKALLAAVNHDGDSDSTGAITGNILGAYLGLSRIPSEWVEKVELKDVILQIADDLLDGYRDDEDWNRRYCVGH